MKKSDLKRRYTKIFLVWRDKKGKLSINKYKTVNFALERAREILAQGGVVLAVWGE